MTPLRTRRGAAWACLAVLAAAGPGRADLLDYVKKPEPAYAWKLKGKHDLPAGTVYDLQLVSQAWQGITWEHQLQVYQPKGVKPASTLLLWNQGGRASVGSMGFGLDLARKMNAPCAFLYGIPNQPLLGGKKEDALIAETFVRFLDSKDENWPLLFPMAKSLVKAMDALQAFAEQEWKSPVKTFVVSGGSKRGWTTWLTAVADPRVKAIAPMVIDTLNMREQGPYQLKSFGAYSEQVRDYTARGLLPMADAPAAKRLWSMVDPYTYRDRLTLPKLLIHGANDEYWTTDALNLYWDGLKGDKWVLYVPNAGHKLEQKGAGGQPDRTRAVNALAAFGHHVIFNTPMPKLTWKHDDAAGEARLTVRASPPPKGARLWVAKAPTRDFRKAEWVARPVSLEEGRVMGVVAPPGEGFVAFFAELDYDLGELPYHLSTQMRILGK